MKLVHISDVHIHDGPILDADPVRNFAACLAHVKSFHGDADRVVITGDLTHKGDAESYRRLRAMIEASGLAGDQAPRLLIGNHDDRETFAAVFPETARDADGFLQWTEETPAGLFVYLDTVTAGSHAGHYCERRRAWLGHVLDGARAAGQAAFLFMHHNPLPVHVANADTIGLVHEREMTALLAAHRDVLRHIFFGHCHYTLSGAVAGIPFSAPRSTNHPCWPDFSGDAFRVGYGVQTPCYNLCFLNERGTVVHAIDFLLEDSVRWLEADESGWVAD
ncbi:metallophosphoesterase [Zavarzinia compransoris]|uniref:metallophosphoesterase n=1 Tax=Zavarzinia marina TaxID=2911065 RepID=UPI001F3F80C9|nr:metallophosphoesterase [Zavarzinia marina]MCF4164694.1 metallophosphoesterase [Zavarzinia marina]